METAGKYVILDKLGEGGSGVVYRVKDTNTGIIYAMKCFANAGCGERETKVLKELHHPGIPKLADCFIFEDTYCLVMEYEDGVSLNEYVEGLNRTEVIFKKLVDIVAYLHSRPVPVVHGDLKPENIYVTAGGEVKLLDFGSAFRFSNRKQARESTPGYAAPELYQGVCRRESDVYALGYILVYITSGKDPGYFSGCKEQKSKRACERITTERRIRPVQGLDRAVLRRLGLSAPLAEIAEKCIRREAKERYASAVILSDALRKAGKRHRIKRIIGRAREMLLTDGGGILALYGLYSAKKLCILAGCVFLLGELLIESHKRNRFGEECTRIYSLFLAG